ncbi:hypothetical protein [Thermogemmatispora sp.]|uniref:hypothetical protein n=1 Tax=Thermogemmatispora sp. TaxID=1968838 RepID=UPI001D974802|nr:hypothetical protein [Thermogemmatispora sp.]MBX5449044.1 hypothetical protein [Thermogemmatispora sp.]
MSAQEQQVSTAGAGSQSAGTAGQSTEERHAFGTAKTESLRDSGWWRLAIPAFIILASVALFLVPLVLLITLLITTSFNGESAAAHQGVPLAWLWITMIVIEVVIAALIARGLLKIFLTDSWNYRT